MKILTLNKTNCLQRLNKVRKRQSKSSDVGAQVQEIITEVKKFGDTAVRKLTKKYDGVTLDSILVSNDEIAAAFRNESPVVIKELKKAKANIVRFHSAQIKRKDSAVCTLPGVKLWREFRPIEKVGLYIPGGKAAYPSTVLMLGVPAQLAGCKEIVLCVPPNKDGSVPSAVLVAATLCSIKKIYKVGGAQAIAAMAYGTKTIPKVSKIFGPGNQYVTTAKILVYGEVDIDMPAGPSEVLILADESAPPSWMAADLLSQLEHGEDSQAILVTTSEVLAKKVVTEVKKQIRQLSRRKIIKESLKKSYVLVTDSLDTAYTFINEYAPEHLEIVIKNEIAALQSINNAGSVFIGKYTSEPLGDYATGANHTLPTSGFAKMFSPLSLESFGKKMQVQKVSKKGFSLLQKTVEVLATREGLDAHKNAITIRKK